MMPRAIWTASSRRAASRKELTRLSAHSLGLPQQGGAF